MIRNIIFDWSGTLVDDLPPVWKATNYVLTRAGRPEMTLEMFRAEFSLPFTQFYEKHTPDVPLAQLEEWFHESFREAQALVSELPHAREFLVFCRSRGLRTFLLSTVHPDYFKTQAAVTGFGAFIDAPYTGVRDKRHKIHEILLEHGLKPEETLFIGDMEHDIETARHGGILSVAVLTGYNTVDQLRRARPNLIVEHLRELQGVFQENEMRLHPKPGSFKDNALPVVTVGGLIFNDHGEVFLVRTHKWSNLWGIPGGKTKWGETSEQALRRELKEETNLDIADSKLVMVQDCIHSTEFYRDAHFVLLNYSCRVSGSLNVRLNHEAQEFRWVSLASADHLPLNNPTRVLVKAVREDARFRF
jgi:phosphoglycolate phosphatase-like HAD superfamily hydrolase/ADP-ribose pyrophosphatase YjhB (NUDIX family)